jgi:hypothetical protein
MTRQGVDQAQRLWRELTSEQRFDLGDQFVLGGFDWGDWFEEDRLPGAIGELERLRTLWEMEQ